MTVPKVKGSWDRRRSTDSAKRHLYSWSIVPKADAIYSGKAPALHFSTLLSLIYNLSQPPCTDCGGTVIEYNQAAGNGFCVDCGTVVEENTIVNEVAFAVRRDIGRSRYRARLFCGTGSKWVSLKSRNSIDSTFLAHARMSGPYGNRGSNESREQTIANGSLI